MKFLANNAKKIAAFVIVICVGRIIYIALSSTTK